MSFSLRLLTLVAFAAHAVLGCCLSHGDCRREHAQSVASIGCDHDHHTVHANHHHEHSQLSKVEVADVESMVDANCDSTDNDHSHHCHDTQCVFSAAASSSGFCCNVALAANVAWVGVLMDLRHQPERLGKNARRSTDHRALSCENQALMQVWQI